MNDFNAIFSGDLAFIDNLTRNDGDNSLFCIDKGRRI